MSAVQTPPRPPAAAPPTPARERLRTLMGESGYDTDTVQAIADALKEQVPTPPWDDPFLMQVCAAIDLLRDAGRTAGQVKTRVAGFKQAAEQWGPEDPRDWRQEFWRAEIGAAAAADRAATTLADAYAPAPPPC